MSIWDDIVLGLCLALLGFLLWQEWRRADRARLLWRVIATAVAVGALACLGLPIGYWRERGIVNDERVLLTEGYDRDSVGEFLRAHPGMDMDTVGVDGGRLHVFGYGLRKEEWMRMRPAAIDFHPGVLHGVVDVDWRRKLKRGDRFVVQGRWAGGTGTVLLMGMGEVIDSAKMTAAGDFSLGAVPAQVGRAVYRLAVVEGKDTVAREELPVEVEAGAPLKILLLAASPDFENSFLMKWLSGNGHAVASRTIVSRGKAQEAFVNREAAGLGVLTPGLLGGFDVVVADGAVLPVRESVQSKALWREIEQRGMGLLLRVDSAGLDSMVRVMRGRAGKILARDSLGHVVVGAFVAGRGKVVFTALNTSYSRLLSGEREAYASYWSGLLREAARRGEAREEWSFSPELPRVGEEVEVQLQTAAGFPQGDIGGTAVYLAEDAGLPFDWRGRYWPEKAGWQMVYRPMGDTAWWYVWPVGAWKGVERMRRMEETRNYVAAGVSADGGRANRDTTAGGRANRDTRERVTHERVTHDRVSREWVEFSRVWFWGLFLLGVAFLWVERKLGGMNG